MINWRNPLTKSIALHLAVCLIIFIAGLSWFSRTPDKAIVPISVEILNVTDKNNIPKAQVAESKPQPKPTPPKPKPKPKVEPKPEKVAEKKPEPKPTEKPVVKPTEKEEPKEEPKDEPKEETKEEQIDELDSLLKSLEEEEEAAQPDMAQTQEEYDPTQPLSVSEVSAITGLITKQIQKCWNVPAGARNAADLEVRVDIDIAEDGTLTFVGFSESAKYNDEFYRVAADSARRAILDPRCNPLRELPPADKYDFWSELNIGFNPKNQIY